MAPNDVPIADMGDTKTKSVSIRLDSDLAARLEAFAKGESERTGYGISVGDVLRRFAVEGLDRAGAKTSPKPRSGK